MKKYIIILAIGLFLASCGSTCKGSGVNKYSEYEYIQHNTIDVCEDIFASKQNI